MSGSAAFLTALSARRSYYKLKKESTISDKQIQSIIKQILQVTPSAFNSQSTRVVLLVKQDHEKFWGFVRDALKEMLGENNYQGSTADRINSFQGAYGTILFYEDTNVVERLKEKYPLYADNFPVWSEHTSGMHQSNLWTALRAEGLGANLQHYNPIADAKAAAAFDIPESWKLRSQLVFGTPDMDLLELNTNKLPTDQVLKVFGADQ